MGPLQTIAFILRHPFNRGRPAAALLQYLRWQMVSRLAPAVLMPFVGETKILASHGMTGATGNIYCGLHEFEDMAFALHLLRPGDLFVDVGANVGSYSLLAKTAGADVIAFEPGERFDDLTRNMAVNNFAADCRCAAVGAAAGLLRFTVGRDAQNRIADADEPSVEVAVVTLDAEVPRPAALIKVDVEGHETAVFAGGRQRFAEAQALLIELVGQGARFGYDEAELIEQIEAMGFRQASYDPWTRTLGPPRAGGNSLFVKAGLEERLVSAPRFAIQGRLI